MNQILIVPINHKKYIVFFRIELTVSILIIVGCLVYMLISYCFADSSNQNLLDSYQISKLYANNSITLSLTNTPQIIGTLSIPKINIHYSIISQLDDDLLKKSICKFYGPNPNEIGNLCIAGHNYNNDTFFSNLHQLEIGDTVFVEDNLSKVIEYRIYKKYETPFTDTSCTLQDTFGKKELTLVTCNNLNGNRIIVKAVEKFIIK